MIDKKCFPIGGIKFSEERVHFSICRPHKEQTTINDFLQQISNKQVTIPFLCHSFNNTRSKTCFCVSTKDVAAINEIIHSSFSEKLISNSQTNIASVTIFPHKNNMTLVTMVMEIMEELGLPVYSFSTSISALVFNTDFHQLEIIASRLTESFDLPANHSPFHPEFELRQPRNSTESENLPWKP